jgi:hypothetical protein
MVVDVKIEALCMRSPTIKRKSGLNTPCRFDEIRKMHKVATNAFRDWLTHERLRENIDNKISSRNRLYGKIMEERGSDIGRRIIANIIFKNMSEDDQKSIRDEWGAVQSERHLSSPTKGRRIPGGIKSLIPEEKRRVVQAPRGNSQLSLFSFLVARDLRIVKFSSQSARSLGDVLIIKDNFPNADFWIWRKHNPGRTIKEHHPEAIGISIRDEFRDQIDPKYLYYIFQYYEATDFWKQYEVGTTIKSIRASEIRKMPIAFLSPGT